MLKSDFAVYQSGNADQSGQVEDVRTNDDTGADIWLFGDDRSDRGSYFRCIGRQSRYQSQPDQRKSPAGFLLFLFGLLIFLILKIIDDRKTLPTKKFIASLDSLGSYLGLARSSSEPFALYYHKVMGHLDTRGKKQNNLLRTGQINAHICALINSTLYGNRQITDKDLLLIKKEIRNIKRMKKRLRIHSLFINQEQPRG